MEAKQVNLEDLWKNFMENKGYEVTTKLCHIMKKEGSDKGLDVHNFTTFYTYLFEKYWTPQEVKFLLEIGIGSTNASIPSNMGPFGRPGASLKGWKQYFPQAYIFGADIDRDCLFHEEKIETFFCNQLDPTSFKDIFEKHIILSKIPLDVIIDDGLHALVTNLITFKACFPYLKPGGLFIIEDVHDLALTEYEKNFKYLAEEGHEVLFARLPSPRMDNRLIVIRKKF